MLIKPDNCVRKENNCLGCKYSYDPDLFDGGCIRADKTEKEIAEILSELEKDPGRAANIKQGNKKATLFRNEKYLKE